MTPATHEIIQAQRGALSPDFIHDFVLCRFIKSIPQT